MSDDAEITQIFVKSDIYPQHDGTVNWTATIHVPGRSPAETMGSAANADEALNAIEEAARVLLDGATVVEHRRIARVVNPTTGQRDNLN